MTFSKTRRMDISRAIDGLIILSFSLFFLKLIKSGDVRLYVHPRIIPFIKFASLYLFIIVPFLMRGLFKKTSAGIDAVGYIIIGFTLMLAFAIPPITLNASNAGSRTGFAKTSQGIAKGSSVSDSGGSRVSDMPSAAADDTGVPGQEEDGIAAEDEEQNSGNANSDNAENDIAGSDGGTGSDENGREGDELSGETGTDEIVVDAENYLTTLDDMYNNMDAYAGKKIEIGGLIYKEDGMRENEFVVGRYAMTCCTADMSLAGILCRGENGGSLKQDQWVRIKGTVEKGSFGGEPMPVVRVTDVTDMAKPEDEYVYP